MEKHILKQHLNTITGNIGALQNLLSPHSFESFEKEEQVKEMTYEYLQEIGQAASEIDSETDVVDLDVDFNVLKAFSNARYNQEAEMDHHSVWAIATNELPEISEEIEHSNLYNGA